jgi:hypothetical protein
VPKGMAGVAAEVTGLAPFCCPVAPRSISPSIFALT